MARTKGSKNKPGRKPDPSKSLASTLAQTVTRLESELKFEQSRTSRLADIEKQLAAAKQMHEIAFAGGVIIRPTPTPEAATPAKRGPKSKAEKAAAAAAEAAEAAAG